MTFEKKKKHIQLYTGYTYKTGMQMQMQNLPVTLAEIVTKSKQSFAFLISPFNHLHYHVVIVVNTAITNNLQI